MGVEKEWARKCERNAVKRCESIEAICHLTTEEGQNGQRRCIVVPHRQLLHLFHISQ